MRTLDTRHGDTIIEVIIAITIFCLVAIISINLMSSGINSAEGSLELTMARNEIDAQAEALRFIQNSFLAERELDVSQQQYTQLWHRLTRGENDCGTGTSLTECGLAIEADPDRLPEFSLTTCEEAYDSTAPRNIPSTNAFVINTRLIEPSNISDVNLNNYFDGRGDMTYNRLLGDIIVPATIANTAPLNNTGNLANITFSEAPLYPRLVFSYSGYNHDQNSEDLNEDEGTGLSSRLYRTVARAEGIWVIAVRGQADRAHRNQPEFFDFYIRTCWYAPGRDYPNTIGTIVRLYNPEIID